MTPPTLKEVEAYVKEKGLCVDPQFFVEYYEADDWKSQGKPVKSWKQKILTWNRKNLERQRPHKCYCGRPGVYIDGYDDTGFATWRCVDHKPRPKQVPAIVNTIKLKTVPNVNVNVNNERNKQVRKLAE